MFDWLQISETASSLLLSAVFWYAIMLVNAQHQVHTSPQRPVAFMVGPEQGLELAL